MLSDDVRGWLCERVALIVTVATVAATVVVLYSRM